jgi:hypothetical protein
MFQHTRQLMVVSLALTLSVSLAIAARPEAKQDSIELVGSVDIHNRDVQKMRLTEHQGRNLLYLENSYERTATVVDVTDIDHPKIAREVTLPRGLTNIEVLAGDAALVADYSPQAPLNAKSLSIAFLDDRDNHRRVGRTFENVTALLEDDRRGLIYLVDQDGLKILRETFSPDPQVEREFEKRLMYDR